MSCILVLVVLMLMLRRLILLFDVRLVELRPDRFFICGEELLLISDSFFSDFERTMEVLLINYFDAFLEVA